MMSSCEAGIDMVRTWAATFFQHRKRLWLVQLHISALGMEAGTEQ